MPAPSLHPDPLSKPGSTINAPLPTPGSPKIRGPFCVGVSPPMFRSAFTGPPSKLKEILEPMPIPSLFLPTPISLSIAFVHGHLKPGLVHFFPSSSGLSI